MSTNNIIGLAVSSKLSQWRKNSRYMVSVSLVVVFVLIGGIYKVTRTTQGLSFDGLQSAVQYSIHSPSLQRAALRIVHYLQQSKQLPPEQFVQLYTDWYEEHCLVSTPDFEPGCQMYAHRDKLINYLGYHGPKTYLILLQNSAEVRPNGGFYGSFITVVVSGGMIEQVSVHDSYEVPFADSGVVLNLPQWTMNYLGHNTTTFIAGNKFGFTDRDGKVIASIYNKTYDVEVDGVVFVTTDTLTKLIPSLQHQLRERQFINASVDLIRGHTGSLKKEVYMKQLKDYIEQNNIGLVTQALYHYRDLFAPGMIQVYLPDVDDSLRDTIKQFGWITDLQPYHLYARDINQSYSKIDTFVNKQLRIENQSGATVYQSTGSNILDVSHLGSGTYDLYITYSLVVPGYYTRLIRQLETKYDIVLTERELHILGLNPLFEYKSVVFAGTGIKMAGIKGDIDQEKIFDAPPGQGASYHINGSPDKSYQLKITFSKE